MLLYTFIIHTKHAVQFVSYMYVLNGKKTRKLCESHQTNVFRFVVLTKTHPIRCVCVCVFVLPKKKLQKPQQNRHGTQPQRPSPGVSGSEGSGQIRELREVEPRDEAGISKCTSPSEVEQQVFPLKSYRN